MAVLSNSRSIMASIRLWTQLTTSGSIVVLNSVAKNPQAQTEASDEMKSKIIAIGSIGFVLHYVLDEAVSLDSKRKWKHAYKILLIFKPQKCLFN